MKRKYIEENLELIGDDFLADFTESLRTKDTEKALKNLAFLREKSLDVRLFLEQFLFFLRDRMKESLKKMEFESYTELFEVFEGVYGRLKFSPDPFLLLETSTFRCIVAHSPVQRESLSQPKKEVQEVKNTVTAPENTEKPLAPSGKKEEKASTPPVVESTVSPSEKNSASAFDFARFVEHIRTVPKRSFVGLGLRVSTYSEEENTIVIHPDNDFNYKKLDTADVRLFLQETLDTLFGTGYQIDIRMGRGKSPKKTSLADEAADIF